VVHNILVDNTRFSFFLSLSHSSRHFSSVGKLHQWKSAAAINYPATFQFYASLLLFGLIYLWHGFSWRVIMSSNNKHISYLSTCLVYRDHFIPWLHLSWVKSTQLTRTWKGKEKGSKTKERGTAKKQQKSRRRKGNKRNKERRQMGFEKTSSSCMNSTSIYYV